MDKNYDRRKFLKESSVILTVSGIALITGCKNNDEETVSPAEDLMREHGVLNRILLIYDNCKMRLINGQDFSLDALAASAQIIRTFIEDYHEKLEEDFLFPRFLSANKLVDLVGVLRQQHMVGRMLTEHILNITKTKKMSMEDTQKLIKRLNDFNNMYRPHEAREDTILFPALKKIVSLNEYYSLGEDFEKKEHQLFGKDGFESMVEQVTDIEKQLDIYDLSKYTPTA